MPTNSQAVGLTNLQYLGTDDLGSAYIDAQANARKSWLKYDEIERIANNEVRSDLPSNMPKVNDGSLAATIDKVPKRLFAKPMGGTIKATDRDEDWVAKLVNIILESRIIPNANTDATFLRKWKVAVRNSKRYGSQPIYTFFTQHGTYTGADMSVPYVRNVYLEPGKISDLASDYIFMDSWYTKLQARRLVDKAKDDAASVKAGDLEDADCMWDAGKLQQWYDAGPSGKDPQNMTAAERAGENRNNKGLYKLITCFNRGYQAPFYTFAASLSDDVCGTQLNSNPTGDIPIVYIYDDEDMINPYGKGLIHKAGSNQNVLDNLTQTDVLATQIGNQPPLDIHGDRTTTNLKSLVYSPAAFWFSGQATITPVMAVNPTMYNALPGRFALYKSQQQFLTGTFNNSVSAEAGSPGFSKTPQGVNALQNETDADDNDSLQSIADAYSRVIKNMVNIHMNNMEGTEMLSLEGDQLELLATTDLVPTDENGEPSASQIQIVWDNVRGSFDFQVNDPQSSMQSNDQQQATNIQEAISSITPQVSYYMSQDGYRFNLGEAYHSLLTKFQLENLDKIITKMTPEEKQEAQNAPFPIIDPPQLRYALADVPPEAVPAALAAGGINFDSSAGMSMPWKDQVTALQAKQQAIDGQANAANQAQQTANSALPPQPINQPGPNAPPADSNGQPLPSQDLPDQPQAAQQAAQSPSQQPSPNASSNPNWDSPYASEEVEPSQFQPLQTTTPESMPQRLMEIQEEWSVDPETAMTIAAAQDHGASDQQVPQILQMIAAKGSPKKPKLAGSPTNATV